MSWAGCVNESLCEHVDVPPDLEYGMADET